MMFEVWTSEPRLRVPSAWVRTGKAQTATFRWIVYAAGAGGVAGEADAGTKRIASGTFRA